MNFFDGLSYFDSTGMDGEVVAFYRWAMPSLLIRTLSTSSKSLNIAPELDISSNDVRVNIRAQFQFRTNAVAHAYRWVELRINRRLGGVGSPEELIAGVSAKLDDNTGTVRPFLPLKMNVTDTPGVGPVRYSFVFRASNTHLIDLWPAPYSFIDLKLTRIPVGKVTIDDADWTWSAVT